MKTRILRGIFTTVTCDASTFRRFFGRTRDEILNAIPPGRVLCLGTVWTGELAPKVEAAAEAITSAFAAPGLSAGGVLHAEPAPDVLDLGRQWLGNLQTQILASAADFASQRRPEEAGAEPGTDLGEVVEQLDRLRRDMGTGKAQTITDRARRLRDAARRVTDSLKKRSIDRHHTGDFSRPQSIRSINDANARHWANRSAAPRLDSSGRMVYPRGGAIRTGDSARTSAVRDAEHAVRSASTPHEQLAAINLLNRLNATRDGEPLGAAALLRTPAPQSIADLNARNRLYWATR